MWSWLLDSGCSVSSFLDTMLAVLSDRTSQLSEALEIGLSSKGLWVREEKLKEGTGILRSGVSSPSFLWSAAETEDKIVKS